MFFGDNFVQKEYFDCFDWKTEGKIWPSWDAGMQTYIKTFLSVNVSVSVLAKNK